MSERKGLNGAVKAFDGYGSVNRNAEDKIRILQEEDEEVREKLVTLNEFFLIQEYPLHKCVN